MSKFFTALRRDKSHVELYYNGVKIATMKVSDYNRGNQATIDFEADDNLRFKVIKSEPEQVQDDAYYNKEEFNKPSLT